MRARKKPNFLPAVALPLVVIALVLCFLAGVANVTRGHRAEDKQHLEDTLREAAVACYAVEGFYPPSLAYLEEHYGVQIDRHRYTVHYTAIAENLMPDITVLEK